MTTLFLYMFFVGFGLTVISAVLGAVDAGMDHGHGHGGDGGDGGAHGKMTALSAVNFQTIVAFMMGFGGVGYISTRFGLLGLLVALPLAAAGGTGTGWLVYRFLRFLVRGERPMGPTSWEGVIGRLTVGIREGGTGEMVYTAHGSRKVTAVRSEKGEAIPRGQEVLVLRYEKGIAYVQPWTGLDAK